MIDEQVRREFEAWHKEHSGISLMRHANGGDYVYAESEWQLWLSRQAEIDRLTAELEASRKDAARLDYLDDLNKKFNERMGTVYGWKLDWTCNRWALSDSNLPALSVRAAIDESMESKNDNT